ncbi:uncharacterized protein LOC134191569 [Corticium candelabrum]|uniref:uncharacterized protein LOC134191569 n=1 Tax=Corticium candelabrum TaxID=121492 RepID=UPI002E25B2A1|nr:uncharacterized protein LOC134191569 [Corticium candelabrum]
MKKEEPTESTVQHPPSVQPDLTTTRSGRAVKPPQKLDLYLMELRQGDVACVWQFFLKQIESEARLEEFCSARRCRIRTHVVLDLKKARKAVGAVDVAQLIQRCLNFQVPYTSSPCVASRESTLRYDFDTKEVEVCDGSDWKSLGSGSGTKLVDSKLGSSKDNPAPGCRHIFEAGIKVSGVYWLLPLGASQPFQAYCDQTTEGGGWMLLYAYKHVKHVRDPVVVSLPTDPDGYSHQLLVNLGIERGWARELRFYCSTSAHNRVIHFKTTNNNILNSAYDGKRHYTVNDWKSNNALLAGHSANLPAATTDIYATGQATPGFTDFPFYKSGSYHWGIAPGFHRFECDDYADFNQADTLHRVFVRE